MRTTTLLALTAIATSILAHAEPQTELIGDGMSGWAGNTGDWANVGDTHQTGSEGKLLGTTKGKGTIVNGPTGRTVNLLSEIHHGSVTLHIEFMVPKGSNSGVYLMGRYEVQILDSWGVEKPQSSDCGGIYQRYNEKEGYGYEGTPPNENASKKPGEWQSFDIMFQAPKFDDDGNKTANARFIDVRHNGVLVHRAVDVTGPTRSAAFQDEKPQGPLMLQGDHGPVAYRNIRLQPTERFAVPSLDF